MLMPLTLIAGLSACSKPPEYQADVKLTIDGKTYDYSTAKAQVDQQEEGGRYSVYLLPDAPDGQAPYLCLRTYQAKPVAELWVRYTKPERAEAAGDDLDKYDCFVPGTLPDGRSTLTWTDDDGCKRKRTDTGQEGCSASVRQEGAQLHVSVEATLGRKASGKKSKKAADEPKKTADGCPDDTDRKPTDVIQAKATAVVTLGGG
jgi:hypothetical protein